MKHVTDRLAAWVGGELSAAEAAACEEHLAACPACRAQSVRVRATWEALGCLAQAPQPPRPDLWPAVRERTFGRVGGGWFFGRSPVLRLSLAVGTLAVGILCGRLTGGLAGPRAALPDDDGTLAAVWLEDSTWHSDTSGALADSWLALAESGTAAATATGQGGTK